jgi:signal transduction histidine kinase
LDDRRTALSARARAEWRTLRDDWAGANSWVLARRLVLPALLVWAMADNLAHPWRAAEAALVVIALLIRFTLPSVALLLVVTLVTAPPAAVVALPVIAYAAARRIAAPRRAGPVFAVAAAVLAGNVAIRGVALSWPYLLAIAGGVVVVGLILPGAVGALVGERGRRVEALRERNDILERAHRLGDEQARLQERARIAGEMHDLLGHRLSLISLHAGALEMGTRKAVPALSEQASLVRGTAKTALDELREVLGILKVDAAPRPDTEGHGDDAGTRTDVSALVLASQRAGIPVELHWEGGDLVGLDGRVRRAVHRVVRESLTNVHKHAPGATTTVWVERGPEWVRVEIRNTLPAERGRPAPGSSMGLVGLQERVRLVGGTIRAGASLDRTLFVVAALLPLVPVEAAPHIDHPDLADRQTSGPWLPDETAPHHGSSALGSTDTMRKPAKTILLVLLGLVVVLCGGGIFAVKVYTTKAKEASITPETYETIQTGQAEAQVRGLVGGHGSIARDALFGTEPAKPAGSTCAYALSAKTLNDMSQLVYRFCFADGRLVEKRAIQGPGAEPTSN